MSNILKTVSYISSDAKFMANSYHIGLVRKAKETTVSEICSLSGIGDAEASAAYCLAKSYEIELVCISSTDSVEFSDLSGFTLTAEKASGSIIYSSCEVKKLETLRTAGEDTVLTVTITAKSRREEQNE